MIFQITVLYCTVLYCTVLYCTVLYSTPLLYSVLFCSSVCVELCCTVLHCTVPFCTVLCCIVLCRVVLYSVVVCCAVVCWFSNWPTTSIDRQLQFRYISTIQSQFLFIYSNLKCILSRNSTCVRKARTQLAWKKWCPQGCGFFSP